MRQLLSLKGGDSLDSLNMLFTIVNRSDERNVLRIINKYKVGFKFIMYGKGTASSSLLEYFELNDEEKAVIISIVPPVVCKNLLIGLKENMNVEELGKGISFSVPLSSGGKYMLDFYRNCEMEDINMEFGEQHLVVAIVNQGYAEKVMNEAKKAGATGGTIISGRSLGNDKVVKVLNISIEPEKDIVLILVSDKKNDIMNAIVEKCGLKTPGAGICFSLPVDYVAGLNKEINN